MSEENYLSGLNAGVHGGDEISFTSMGLVAGTVLAHTCANTVSATNPIFVNDISFPPCTPAFRPDR